MKTRDATARLLVDILRSLERKDAGMAVGQLQLLADMLDSGSELPGVDFLGNEAPHDHALFRIWAKK